MSMGIEIRFNGDVDRLPHKDLAEHIIKEVNAAIKAAVEKAGPTAAAFTTDNGTERRLHSKVRPLSGDQPYQDWGENTSVDASWMVHLPDPS